MMRRGVFAAIVLLAAGCASARSHEPASASDPQNLPDSDPVSNSTVAVDEGQELVTPVGFQSSQASLHTDDPSQSGADDAPSTSDAPARSLPQVPADPAERLLPLPESESDEPPPTDPLAHDALPHGLPLDAVIASVYESYPLLASALYSRTIAEGEQLAARGAFDLRLNAASENGPTGFYQTYRQRVGVVQPTYSGGEVFGGYRIGRGHFEPWYLERQTNDGGEFRAGLAVPLARNREIDERRANLFRADYGRQLVEPDIHAQLIGFVQEASYSYWEWVAAGENFRIADRILELTTSRTQRIQRQVELQLLERPVLIDNQRLVAERRGRRADAARKLQQAAVRLSLYYRGLNGEPLVPDPSVLPRFPDPHPVTPDDVLIDIQQALTQRPEAAVLDFLRRQLEVDYAQAENELLPSIDAVFAGLQDVGAPTSPKNDKGEFELEASLYVDVPLQRRRARGKMQATRGKIAQLNAQRQLTEDRIVTDVQSVYAGLMSAYEQVQEARQAVEYAEDLARRERINFDEGASELLTVTLREQFAVESAEREVAALLLYFQARADYRAALAQDRLP
jgi:outer membrane protein TolC